MSTLRGATKKFVESAVVTETAECLIWPFSLTPKGYPNARDAIGVYKPTRRVCERTYGPAPSPAHQAAHLCGNRACLNKAHLVWATQKENEQHKSGHGTRRGLRLFNDEQIREIRSKHLAGRNVTSLAFEYAVTFSSMKQIVTRASYSNAT
jgi:hypothetical protein